MKDATKEGLHIKCQKDAKEFVTAEEKRKFWEMNLLGTSSAKSLLYTVYFYIGKIFGLRGGDHRNIVLNNFELEEPLISNIFPEQLSISVTKKAQNTSLFLLKYIACI